MGAICNAWRPCRGSSTGFPAVEEHLNVWRLTNAWHIYLENIPFLFLQI